jgi:hypothetical protein
MSVRRYVVPVTVDASGDATKYTPPIYGTLLSVRYVKTDFADGVDFVITTETSLRTLWSEEDVNASATRYPRGATNSTAGAASVYVAAGEAVNDVLDVSAERIKIVVAAGGVSKSGAFHFTIDG